MRFYVCLAFIVTFGCSAPPALEVTEPSDRVGDDRLQVPRVIPLDANPCPDEDEETQSACRSIAYVRAAAGLPALRFDAATHRAARAHCAYVAANNLFTHVEERGKPEFTGVRFADRMVAANASVTPGAEVLANIGGAEAIEGTAGFLNSVYHRAPFLRSEMVSFGYGHATNCATIDFGKADGPSDGWVVWPPDGARSVQTTFHASRELPNPVSPLEIVGSPISLISHLSLSDVRATLVGPSGEVTAITITSTDASGLVHPGEIHLVPERPLAPMTTYTATFTAQAGTSPFHATTSFTTGVQ
jgi:uncharacterized protein YkwD